MDNILYELCRHDVALIDSWHPYPATFIANILDMPIGKVRYHLRKLKRQGLVYSYHEGGITEDGDVFCL